MSVVASTFTFPAVSPVELIVVPPALTLSVAVTLSTSRFGFNATLITSFSASAVTAILSSPANFNVVVPVSVGFTAIVFPSLSFAVHPASTLSVVSFIAASNLPAVVVKFSPSVI